MFKKLFSAITAVVVVASTLPVAVFGQAQYGAELEGAYQYALAIGATTQQTIDAARLYDSATRAETAKIMSQFATDVLGREIDEDADCNFTDLAAVAGSDLADYAVQACQLGLMGVGTNGVFNPNGTLSRGEFGTILSRAIYGDKYNGGTPFYANHLEALKAVGVMNDISNPMMPEIRGYMFLMLQRADEDNVVDATTPEVCEDPMTQLSCALGLDDCPAVCQDDDMDDEDDMDDQEQVFEGEGDLEITISRDTPASQTIPKSVGGIVVASFDVEADDADVRIDSITVKRYGFSSETTIDDFALMYDGARLSKARNDDSEGEAILSIQGGFVVKAGETETIDVVVSVGDAGNDTFQVAIEEVSSSAETVSITSERSNLMTVGTQSGPELTLSAGSTVPDVKIGQQNIAIAEFDLENDSNSPEQDVIVNSITFEQIGGADTESDLANFTLLIDGEEFAETARSQGDFITFYNEDGYLIEDGNEVQLEVRAEILDGVTETVILELDNALDIMGEGSIYGAGIKVVGAGVFSEEVTIDAGEITISAIDPEFDEARYDRDDVILGKLSINVTEGDRLELDYVKFDMDIQGSLTTGDAVTLFESVELINETKGGKITLDVEAVNGTNLISFESDTDLGEVLNNGRNTFRVQADLDDLNSSLAADFADTTFQLKIVGIDGTTSSNLQIVESSDDELVGDITPSTLTWATWDGTDSEADITAVNLSASFSAVKGAEDITALTFEVENNGALALKVQEFTITGTDFSNAEISEIRLYKDSVDEANLIKSRPGSQINSEEITLSSFVGGDVEIAVDETTRFIVTVSLVDSDDLDGAAINLSLTAARIRDADNNLLSAIDVVESPRTINVSTQGTLELAIDNNDSRTDHVKHVLGNTVSSELLAVKLTAQDEDVRIEDFTLQFSGEVADAVTKVHLFDANGNEIVNKNVASNSTSITFNNVDYVVEEGSEYVYVRTTTSKIGKDQNSTAGVSGLGFGTPSVIARGVSSSSVITTSANATGLEFNVVPVRISNLSFVNADPQGQVIVDTNLASAENYVGILMVTADSTTNTREANATTPKLQLRQFRFSVNLGGVIGTYLNLREVGGTQTLSGNISNGIATVTGDTENEFQIEPGQTKYYEVIVALTGDVSEGDSVQLKLENLDSTDTIQFSTDESGATVFGGLRLDLGTLTAPRVTRD